MIYDAYGKDLPPLGSGGKEPTYRLENGTLVRLTAEEYDINKAKQPAKKPKTNRRGNRFYEDHSPPSPEPRKTGYGL